MTGVENGGAAAHNKRRHLAIAAAVLVMSAGLTYAATFIEWREVGRALAVAHPGWVLAAVLANLAGLPLWTLSVRLMLPNGEPVDFRRLLEVQAVTLAATQILSIVTGGATAVYFLIRHAGLSRNAALAVLALEQVVSGIVKLILVGAAAMLVASSGPLRTAWLPLFGAVAAAFVAVSVALRAEGRLRRIASRGDRIGRASGAFADWCAKLDVLRRPARLAAVITLALARRGLEAVAALAIQITCGVPVSFELALLVIAAIAVATILPGPPGNLGLYEAAVVFAYGRTGIAVEIAVAAAVLQHAAYLVASAVPGYLLLATGRVWPRSSDNT